MTLPVVLPALYPLTPTHPQCYERNSGRDPFPVFLKRGPLPKEKPRGATLTGRFPKSCCYKPQDFRTGLTINVLGRDFFLHDCDDFTRQWYQVSREWAAGSCMGDKECLGGFKVTPGDMMRLVHDTDFTKNM